jgi:hypothetical protein
MCYFDLVMTPEAGGIHPVDVELSGVTGLERLSLLHIDAFDDGTGVLLYHLHGDPDMLRGALDTIPDDVHVIIRHVGQYSPGRHDTLSLLIDCQREGFEQAVEAGYYEITRRGNQSESRNIWAVRPPGLANTGGRQNQRHYRGWSAPATGAAATRRNDFPTRPGHRDRSLPLPPR